MALKREELVSRPSVANDASGLAACRQSAFDEDLVLQEMNKSLVRKFKILDKKIAKMAAKKAAKIAAQQKKQERLDKKMSKMKMKKEKRAAKKKAKADMRLSKGQRKPLDESLFANGAQKERNGIKKNSSVSVPSVTLSICQESPQEPGQTFQTSEGSSPMTNTENLADKVPALTSEEGGDNDEHSCLIGNVSTNSADEDRPIDSSLENDRTTVEVSQQELEDSLQPASHPIKQSKAKPTIGEYPNRLDMRGIPGLLNEDNKFYINDILQRLCQNETLKDYFLSNKYLDDLRVRFPRDGTLALNFAHLMRQVWNAKRKSPFRPTALLQTFQCSTDHKVYGREDAGDFMKDLLSLLHDQLIIPPITSMGELDIPDNIMKDHQAQIA